MEAVGECEAGGGRVPLNKGEAALGKAGGKWNVRDDRLPEPGLSPI